MDQNPTGVSLSIFLCKTGQRIHHYHTHHQGNYMPLPFGIVVGPPRLSTSWIQRPPISRIFLISSSSASSFTSSSLPPMLKPLMRIFGTVLRPVLSARKSCNLRPRVGGDGSLASEIGVSSRSSSTTYGAGTILYVSSSRDFARREYGHVDFEKMRTKLYVISGAHCQVDIDSL